LCRSHVVERVQDAGGVFDTSGKKNGGEDGKMESINSSYSDVLVQLFRWPTNTTRPGLHHAEPPATS
jgi:hypothetical protein